MGEVAHLGEHERRTLIVGQPGDVGQQIAQVLALLDTGGEAVGRGLELLDGHGRGLAGREDRETAVAGDREQPGAQLLRGALGEQGAVGAQEGLLQRVLALVLGAEHVAAEAEQRPVVTVVDDLEGALVTGRGELRQAGVVEPPDAEPGDGESDCGRCHSVTHLPTPEHRQGLATCQA